MEVQFKTRYDVIKWLDEHPTGHPYLAILRQGKKLFVETIMVNYIMDIRRAMRDGHYMRHNKFLGAWIMSDDEVDEWFSKGTVRGTRCIRDRFDEIELVNP